MNAEQLNDLMIAVSLLAALLLVGTFLRARLRLLQKILLPSSLIAGFIGLALSPQALGVLPPGVIEIWAALPGRLISVVFACMFLGHAIPSLRTVWREAGPQICYGFLAGFGQYFVAIVVTMALLVPLFGGTTDFRDNPRDRLLGRAWNGLRDVRGVWLAGLSGWL
ncbi:MAG: hypothetical protein AB2L13_20475 [Spirochaetota bacterium]